MREFIVVALAIAGLGAMVHSYCIVAREDRQREEVDESLWQRSLADYKARAHARAAGQPVPEPSTCHGRIRKALPLATPADDPTPTVYLAALHLLERRSKQLDRRSIPPQ